MKKILGFIKIEHTIFSIPLLFAGAWLGAGRAIPPVLTLLWIVLAGVGARVLGMAANRLADRHIDGQNPRTRLRELPAGKMSVGVASTVAFAGLVVYLVSCALLGPTVLKLSPVPALVLLVYSFLKRFTALCHFGIGLVLGLAPIGAYVAVRGDITPASDIILLAFFAFCWISGFDIIYGLQDIESDRKHHIHSIPAALGSRKAQLIAACVHAVAFATLVALLQVSGGGFVGFAVLFVALGGFIAAYLPIFPLPVRFFPISSIAGIAGALVPIAGSLAS